MSRERIVRSRVLRNGKRDDGAFDRDFWQEIGAEGIFAAAWDMVKEVELIRGQNASESRLQRHVSRTIRRAG
mgnify:CR=1 FL=1